MPGPIIKDPTPEWLKAKNASVLDPTYKKIARTLADILGITDPQSQVVGMMTPLVPEGQAMVSKPLQKAAGTLRDLVERAGIKAFHGSPHDFDKFSLSKIGTGEGAQAYGHGLYFAENEGVARQYRDQLSQGVARIGDRRVPVAGSSADLSHTPEDYAAFAMTMNDDIPEDAIQALSNTRIYKDPSAAESARQLIRNGSVSRDAGRMYEVNIKVNPDHLLDWDAPVSPDSPLRSHLREGGERAVRSGATAEQRNAGRDAYLAAQSENLSGAGVYNSLTGLKGGKVAAAEELRRMGIPGIKYLDGGSRAAGEGTRNYVIFDDSLIDILKKYGVALPVIEGLRRKAAGNGGRLSSDDINGVF